MDEIIVFVKSFVKQIYPVIIMLVGLHYSEIGIDIAVGLVTGIAIGSAFNELAKYRGQKIFTQMLKIKMPEDDKNDELL